MHYVWTSTSLCDSSHISCAQCHMSLVATVSDKAALGHGIRAVFTLSAGGYLAMPGEIQIVTVEKALLESTRTIGPNILHGGALQARKDPAQTICGAEAATFLPICCQRSRDIHRCQVGMRDSVRMTSWEPQSSPVRKALSRSPSY